MRALDDAIFESSTSTCTGFRPVAASLPTSTSTYAFLFRRSTTDSRSTRNRMPSRGSRRRDSASCRRGIGFAHGTQVARVPSRRRQVVKNCRYHQRTRFESGTCWAATSALSKLNPSTRIPPARESAPTRSVDSVPSRMVACDVRLHEKGATTSSPPITPRRPTSTPTSRPPASAMIAADRSFGAASRGGAMRSRIGQCRA